jgi:hypothetical protein
MHGVWVGGIYGSELLVASVSIIYRPRLGHPACVDLCLARPSSPSCPSEFPRWHPRATTPSPRPALRRSWPLWRPSAWMPPSPTCSPGSTTCGARVRGRAERGATGQPPRAARAGGLAQRAPPCCLPASAPRRCLPRLVAGSTRWSRGGCGSPRAPSAATWWVPGGSQPLHSVRGCWHWAAAAWASFGHTPLAGMHDFARGAPKHAATQSARAPTMPCPCPLTTSWLRAYESPCLPPNRSPCRATCGRAFRCRWRRPASWWSCRHRPPASFSTSRWTSGRAPPTRQAGGRWAAGTSPRPLFLYDSESSGHSLEICA